MSQQAKQRVGGSRPLLGGALLALAPFLLFNGLWWLNNPIFGLGAWVWPWLCLALVAGASGLLLIRLPIWLRLLLALLYVPVMGLVLLFHWELYVCTVCG